MKHTVRSSKSLNTLTVLLDGVKYFPSGDVGRRDLIHNTAMQLYEDPENETIYQLLWDLLHPKGAELVITSKHLVVKEKNLYLEGIPVPLPPDFARVAIDYIESGYPIEPFRMFWLNSLQNPDQRVRDHVFGYCLTHGVTITDNGFMELYKIAAPYDEVSNYETNLVTFVGEQFNKVRKQKKSPKRFMVFKNKSNGKYSASYCISTTGVVSLTSTYADSSKWEQVGSLNDLANNIEEQKDQRVRYVPYYVQQHKHKFRGKVLEDELLWLGKMVHTTRDKVDPNPNADCSYGKHVGSAKYVKKFQNWNSRTPGVVFSVLVNPRDVGAIPHYDTSKIRVIKYFVRGIVKRHSDEEWEEMQSGYSEDDFITEDFDNLEIDFQRLQKEMEDKIANMQSDALKIKGDQRQIEGTDGTVRVTQILKTRLVDLRKQAAKKKQNNQ